MLKFLDLLVCVGVGLAQFTCPRDGENCLDGNYPNPVDCETFWQCVNCIQYQQTCPLGGPAGPRLHYSVDLDQCVYPEEAKCKATVSPTTPDPSLTSTVTPSPYRGVAFFVCMRDDINGRENPVRYDTISVNLDSTYDPSIRGTIAPPGFSFHSLSVATKENAGAQFDLMPEVGDNPLCGISRPDGRDVETDTLSREIIFQLPFNQRYTTRQNEVSGAYSDQEKQTSWTYMSLDEVFSRVFAFSVARDQPYRETRPSSGNLPLTVVNANQQNIYNPSTHVFTAPENGCYYFSVSAGANTTSPFHIDINRNGEKLMDLVRESTAHQSHDTVSRSFLWQLTAGDTVTLNLGAGEGLYSDRARFQTSFSGMLYNPVHATPLAWSVGRTEPWTNLDDYLVPVPFQRVLADLGNAWDTNEHAMVAPVKGVYFAHVSSGVLEGWRVNVNIRVAGPEEFSYADIFRRDLTHNGRDQMGRSVLISLNADDKLLVAFARATGSYSDAFMQTSFCGFLVSRVD